MTDELSASERRLQIAHQAMENGNVSVSKLVEQYSLTETSIRRDLDILEEQGILKRVRRGAVPYLKDKPIQDFTDKMKINLEAKQRIGKTAAAMIHEGDIVILDSGTTTIQIAKQLLSPLKTGGSITIMTNSIPITQEFSGLNSINMILLGGIFIPEHQATAGPQTMAQLKELTADFVFLGADGISLERGVTTAHILMAEVDRLMAERARKVVLVIDSSKFMHVGFVPVKQIKDFDLIITDHDAPEDVLSQIRDMGVEIQIV